MSEEELKRLCKEEFLKNIKENIKSETIFLYVDGLEKENKKLKEVLDKIKEHIKLEKKVCLGLNNKFGVSICDKLNNLLEEINDR